MAPLESTRLCILLALARGALHGYAIQEQIARDSDDLAHLDYSTIYKSLKRLEQDKLIKRDGKDLRQIRYQLAPAGRRTLKIETDRLAQAVTLARQRLQ